MLKLTKILNPIARPASAQKTPIDTLVRHYSTLLTRALTDGAT
jgi:hypothetical protein